MTQRTISYNQISSNQDLKSRFMVGFSAWQAQDATSVMLASWHMVMAAQIRRNWGEDTDCNSMEGWTENMSLHSPCRLVSQEDEEENPVPKLEP